MGTEAQPIAREFKRDCYFTSNSAIDRQWDPFGISRGLVSHGKVSIYGSQTSSIAAIAGPLPSARKAAAIEIRPGGLEAWAIRSS